MLDNTNSSIDVKSYSEYNPKNCVIYCDPPYKGNKLNGGINRKDFMGFNSEEFWKTMDIWSLSNQVFVSELNAPPNWKPIWEKTYSVRPALQTKVFVEKLFTSALQ